MTTQDFESDPLSALRRHGLHQPLGFRGAVTHCSTLPQMYIARFVLPDGERKLMSSTRMTVLVGTTKGAFLISDGNDRSGWAIQGPYCDGWPINHVIGDPATGTLWAGGGG